MNEVADRVEQEVQTHDELFVSSPASSPPLAAPRCGAAAQLAEARHRAVLAAASNGMVEMNPIT